jgi:hypothetical protein
MKILIDWFLRIRLYYFYTFRSCKFYLMQYFDPLELITRSIREGMVVDVVIIEWRT